ncbi:MULTISPECIES: tetratricopeptide repeat-containing sulfotransferase family protein [Pseudoalteromonas]|uniref:tetratricopeptide repeat-containing sulfotransferase family protein n=1 Tax=Pseudoalteromonas TaxID=53246 RepID=UPI000C34C0A6|nr:MULTISPECIES: sulfotransferase [Pseudoalteromonas]PKG63688.1 hypothetical protein CXF75_13895 [Pseudoalteromonas arctica]PKG70018.1 hypothetical protein CXF64_12715 [Pseudoalteromonas sp. GutCa3]
MKSVKESLLFAIQQLNRGNIVAGKATLEGLCDNPEVNEQALAVLFKVAMNEGDLVKSKEVCKRLISIAPKKFDYVNTLCQLYAASNEFSLAIDLLKKYTEIVPDSTMSYFQLGEMAKKDGDGILASTSFLAAIELGYHDIYTAYVELASVYSELLIDYGTATNYLQQAITIEPNKINAYFNLANIYEQLGDKQNCLKSFNQVLKINPLYGLAHARIADIQTFNKKEALEYELKSLSILEATEDDVLKADMYYALGKAFDDSKDYEKSWSYYTKANSFNRKYIPQYSRVDIEHQVSSTLARELSNVKSKTGDIVPIIICGMFRSGSTLIEQIICTSEMISNGGEIDYLHKQLFNLIDKPKVLLSTVNSQLFQQGYEKELKLRAGKSSLVTDKRPENYLYIDIIKTMYPEAKVIWTQRDIRDNSLSAYFQHLGPSLNYATALNDTVHYHKAQQHVKTHWLKKYPNDIFTVNYDELVSQPEGVLLPLFEFLGVKYQGESGLFHQQKNIVSTASVWQVRKPLYTSSSGRYKNFSRYIKESLSISDFEEFNNVLD